MEKLISDRITTALNWITINWLKHSYLSKMNVLYSKATTKITQDKELIKHPFVQNILFQSI